MELRDGWVIVPASVVGCWALALFLTRTWDEPAVVLFSALAFLFAGAVLLATSTVESA